jgi:hypothetical protein
LAGREGVRRWDARREGRKGTGREEELEGDPIGRVIDWARELAVKPVGIWEAEKGKGGNLERRE